MHLGELGIGEREVGIELHGLLVHSQRSPGEAFLRAAMHVILSAQVVVVGLEVAGRLRFHQTAFPLEQRDIECRYDLAGDVGLDPEDLVQGLVVNRSPQVGLVGCAHQLRRDAHPRLPLPRLFPAYAPLQDVIGSQLSADLASRLLGVPVDAATRARDDAQAIDRGQSRGDLLGDALGEVRVLGAAKIGEGEDD